MTDGQFIEKRAFSEVEIVAELSRRLQAGRRRVVEQLLREHPELAADEELVVELIYREYMILDELGESIAAQQMYDRFPQWRDRLARLLQVHWAFDDKALDDQGTELQSGLYSNGETKNDALSKTVTPDGPSSLSGVGRHSNRIGNYELIEEVGRGGMGVVYKARQLGLDRIVALKVIQSGFVDHRQRRRFVMEAETAAKLQHSNIVQIYEVGEDRGTPFLSMQFIAGQSLEEKISRQVFAPHDAARLVKSLSDTVQFAHEKGIVHRDLKPGNVLLSEGGRPMITDFGLARGIADDQDGSGRTHSMAIIGTPSYMAPEQADFGYTEPAPTADVYGLGAVLYDLLSGKPPFVGTSIIDTIAKVKSQPPLPLRKLSRSIPRDLETICLKCLEKEGHKRYLSAAALSEDLTRFLENRPIEARRAGPIERIWRWSRRYPLVACLSLALAVVILSGVIAVLSALDFAQQGWSDASDKKEELARQLYVSRITLAHREWLTGNLARGNELLNDCDDKLRGWEWHYLYRVFHGELLRMQGHQYSVERVKFSPDDKWLASCSAEWGDDHPGEVIVWDAKTGNAVHHLNGHAGPVYGLSFSPDGSRLITSNVDFDGNRGAVKIWDVVSGRELSELPLFGAASEVFQVTFDPAGKMLATAGVDGKVRLWNVDTWTERLVLTGNKKPVPDVCFSPDGSFLSSAGRDGFVRIWTSSSGELVKRLGGSDVFLCVEFSPCGKFLAGSNYDDVFIWDASQDFVQVAKHKIGDTARPYIRFSPNGRLAASGGPSVKIIDPITGARHQEMRVHDKKANGIDFSSDGKLLVTAGGVQSKQVKLWDLSTFGQHRRIIATPSSYIRDFAVGPCGNEIAIIGSRQQGVKQRGETTLELWDLAKSSRIAKLDGSGQWMTKLDYRHDGKQIAAGCKDGTINLWDRGSNEPCRILSAHDDLVSWVAYHPRKPILASGSADRSVVLWDPTDGTELSRLDLNADKITCLEFSPSGQFLFICDTAGSILIWDLDRATLADRIEAHEGAINYFTIGSDGQQIATSSSDRLLKVWGFDRQSLYGNNRSITLRHQIRHNSMTDSGLSLSPDGLRLAAITENGTLHLWDTLSGNETFTFAHDRTDLRRSTAVEFHTSGNMLLVARGNNVCAFQTKPHQAQSSASTFDE